MAVLGRRLPPPRLAAGRLVAERLAAETITPAFNMANRGRRKVHRAAQRAGVAVALEECSSGSRGLFLIVIDAHHQVGIAGLDWRVDQVAGEDRLIAAASGAHREM